MEKAILFSVSVEKQSIRENDRFCRFQKAARNSSVRQILYDSKFTVHCRNSPVNSSPAGHWLAGILESVQSSDQSSLLLILFPFSK